MANLRMTLLDLLNKDELGVSTESLDIWVKRRGLKVGRRRDGLTRDECEELRRLRRENRVLRDEREIPQKAAVGSIHRRGGLLE